MNEDTKTNDSVTLSDDAVDEAPHRSQAEYRRVAIQRGILTDVSKLLWRIIDDDSQADSLRDEAHWLAFVLSEVMLYWGRSAEPERPRYPAGMGIPRFYSDYLELLLHDLYPHGLPDDHRIVRIMLARMAAEGADDGLMTLDARFDFLESLDEILPGLERDAASDDEMDWDEPVIGDTNWPVG